MKLKLFTALLVICGICFIAFTKIHAAGCSSLPAGPFGTNLYCSYFTDNFVDFPPTGEEAFSGENIQDQLPPAGATQYFGLTSNWQTVPITASSFTSSIQARLFDSTSHVNEARAAGIVDTMLGQKGSSFGGSPTNGITYAQTNWTNWVNLVNAYSNSSNPAYNVNFNDYYPLNALSYMDISKGYFENDPTLVGNCNAANICQPDFTFYWGNFFQTPVWSVVFTFPGGMYALMDLCGNIFGGSSATLEAPTMPPPSPPLTCGNATPSQAIIQPNATFALTVDATVPSGPAPAYTNFDISIPGIPYTNDSAAPITSGQTISYSTPSIHAPPGAGSYPITWQLFNGASAITPVCSGTLSVNDLPYFAAYGTTIQTGGDFLPGCQTGSGSTGGALASWYNNQTGAAGAHALFSAIALGQITGFASAQGRTIGPNNQPEGLSFANSGPGSGGESTSGTLPQMGGNLGESYCFYSPTQPGSTAGMTTPATIGNAPLVSGAHSYNAASQGLNLTGGTIGLNDNLAIYVTGGDVYIGPNTISNVNGIVYNTAGWAMNGSKSNIPSFTLVVTGGNIYIDPSVTELDGTYIAEKDTSGNGGKIFTCAEDLGGGTFKPEPPANMYATCNQQLTVFGAFEADQVNLMRTMGSLEDATSSENPDSVAKACQNSSVKSPVCAAEMFIEGPETFLQTPATEPPNNDTTYYNAITNLPPVL